MNFNDTTFLFAEFLFKYHLYLQFFSFINCKLQKLCKLLFWLRYALIFFYTNISIYLILIVLTIYFRRYPCTLFWWIKYSIESIKRAFMGSFKFLSSAWYNISHLIISHHYLLPLFATVFCFLACQYFINYIIEGILPLIMMLEIAELIEIHRVTRQIRNYFINVWK